MHSWKDSSGIRFNFVVTAFLMASISGKQTPLMTSLSLGNIKNHKEPGQVSRADNPARWRFSQSGTDGCSGHCELAHCPGEAAMRCPATTHASSRALNEASTAGSLYRHAGWLSDLVARTPCGQFLSHRRARSTWAWFWTSTVLLPLGLATTNTSRRLWRLVSGSYSKIQDSSPMMALCSKSGSVWRCLRTSWHTSTRHSFWSLSRNFGTIFAQIFHIPKSSVITFHTLSRLIFNSSTIIWTVNRWLLHTICFMCSTLSAVLLVEGLPLLELSSTSSHPSLNHLCHSKTCERDIVSSLYTSCSIPSASDGVFPSWNKSICIHCSVVMAWWVKFK